ncbi:MAG: hypothetical protein HKN40_03870 [Winogradskyella sp.]|uniref:DUF7793 family protein n=1 Tax=Winogradskyella sp. TaxID=1883156 RepID=UPI0017F5625B|nr:hypothetical protein [Winogradskyella sp.]
MSEIIGFNNAIFWTDDSEILYCEFNNSDPNFKLNHDNKQSYIQAITKLCKGRTMPFLIDLKGTRGTFSVSATKFLANSPELKNVRTSESYITNALSTKLLIGVYKRLYDPITPFGVFSEFDDAENFCLRAKDRVYGYN